MFTAQIKKKLGRSVPVIVSVADGLIGRDALTNELKEVSYISTFVNYVSSLVNASAYP